MLHLPLPVKMTGARLSIFTALAVISALTFAIPVVQWLVSRIAATDPAMVWIGSLPTILCVYIWHRKTKTDSFLPPSTSWKVLVYPGVTITLGLLAISILNAPVSKITGQARSPFEVLDVIALVPIAEELIFRGVLWSVFEKIAANMHARTVAWAATSLLFGAEHLGYWAQAGLPLPPQAFLHALSMIGAGLCFGALRWRSGSLAVPIVVHMLANAMILLSQ